MADNHRVLEASKRIVEDFRRGRKLGRVWGDPPFVRLWATRALAKLPSEMVLPLARLWRSSFRWYIRRSGRDLIRKHATPEDVPWVRKQLSRVMTDGRIYDICTYAETITKFPEMGPFRALRRLYAHFPYSYGRCFIVDAIMATDPKFSAEISYECLWDCEPSVRNIACRNARLDDPSSVERLREIAADPFEDDDVRAAASTALEATEGEATLTK